MITNTNQGQKSLALLLDEIEEAELNSSQDLHRVIRQQALLVKALRRAMAEVASSLRPVKRNIKFQAEITAILEGKEQKHLEEPGAAQSNSPA